MGHTKHQCTIGVGDGSGELFLHGDYASVKECQKKLLELEELRQKVVELERENIKFRKDIPKPETTSGIRADAAGKGFVAGAKWGRSYNVLPLQGAEYAHALTKAENRYKQDVKDGEYD